MTVFVAAGVTYGQVFPPLLGEQMPLDAPELPAEVRQCADRLSLDRWFVPIRIVRIASNVSPEAPGFVIEFPGATRAQLERTEASRDESSRVTWFGRDALRDSYGGFVSGSDGVTGVLRIGARRYTLAPLGNGWHLLGLVPAGVETRPCGTRPVPTVPISRIEGPAGGHPLTSRPPGCPSIDVLVIYTKFASTLIPSFEPNIQIAAALKNAIHDINATIYSNSGTHAELNLVRTHMTDTPESSDHEQDLKGLVDPSDDFAPLAHGLRDRYAADVVLFVGVYLSEGMAAAVGATEGTAFAVVSAFMYDHHDPAVEISPLAISMAHEIGHLQGAAHSIVDTGDPFPHGHAYCFSVGGQDYGSVLSRKTECGQNTKRIPYFSNPEITYPPGDPGAVVIGTAATNDNARVLDETHCTVAGFRPATVVMSPASTKIRKGSAADITVSVTINDEPVPGAIVELAGADPLLVSVPATATTDAAGIATVTIQSIGQNGATQLSAHCKGGTDQINVDVVNALPWIILVILGIIVLTIGLILRRAANPS
jgi:hypothetical protein